MECGACIQRAAPEIWTHTCIISGLDSFTSYLINVFLCTVTDLEMIHTFLRVISSP